jgi:PIN domain nuclease of toxin-antitoxin system
VNRRLLLDSHILLWALTGSAQLSRRAREAILEAGTVYVSSASIWELGIKAEAGKLKTPEDLEEQFRAARFTELPITLRHAAAAAKLARFHADPFDRMLVAQASLEALTLVTSDKRLADYGIEVLLS